jgi:hypothetical protein
VDHRPRGGHDDYVGLDHRVEFEVGLTNRLQTSFYLNFSAERVGKTSSGLVSDGVSSEWKYKFTDPVADPVGSRLRRAVRRHNFYEIEGS